MNPLLNILHICLHILWCIIILHINILQIPSGQWLAFHSITGGFWWNRKVLDFNLVHVFFFCSLWTIFFMSCLRNTYLPQGYEAILLSFLEALFCFSFIIHCVCERGIKFLLLCEYPIISLLKLYVFYKGLVHSFVVFINALLFYCYCFTFFFILYLVDV